MLRKSYTHLCEACSITLYKRVFRNANCVRGKSVDFAESPSVHVHRRPAFPELFAFTDSLAGACKLHI